MVFNPNSRTHMLSPRLQSTDSVIDHIWVLTSLYLVCVCVCVCVSMRGSSLICIMNAHWLPSKILVESDTNHFGSHSILRWENQFALLKQIEQKHVSNLGLPCLGRYLVMRSPKSRHGPVVYYTRPLSCSSLSALHLLNCIERALGRKTRKSLKSQGSLCTIMSPVRRYLRVLF